MELINPKFKTQKKSIWVIIHVNTDNLYRIDTDLERFVKKHQLPPGSLTAYVPTVRVLRKKLKGKMIFETVPLLFTYGFIQLPRKFCTPDNMQALKNQVNAIHSYVNDLSNGRVAFARQEEIKQLYENLVDYSVYDKLDLEILEEGKIVILHGYPFENIHAKILKIDHDNERVKVEILGDSIMKTANVDFDNIIWSVYHGEKDENEMKEVLLGDLKAKYKTNTNKYE